MTGFSESMDALPEEAIRHYAEVFDESQRLVHPSGQLELARSQELILRYLPPPPATVLDVGGGVRGYRDLLTLARTFRLPGLLDRCHASAHRAGVAGAGGTA